MAISTEKELGEALRNNQDYIEIEGDLVRKVIKIKAVGNIAWAVAIGAIGVAVLAIMYTRMYTRPEPTTQVLAKFAAGITGGSAAVILGTETAVTAISIAVAAGTVGALNALREYEIVNKSDNKLILRKK